MKKLFPEAPDVPQSVANRAVRVIEKHLRLHRVDRVNDLPEEAKVRLYRDLRFFFEGDGTAPGTGANDRTIRGFFTRLWEKLEDFLSAAEVGRSVGPVVLLAWASFGESTRLAFLPAHGSQSNDD